MSELCIRLRRGSEEQKKVGHYSVAGGGGRMYSRSPSLDAESDGGGGGGDFYPAAIRKMKVARSVTPSPPPSPPFGYYSIPSPTLHHHPFSHDGWRSRSPSVFVADCDGSLVTPNRTTASTVEGSSSSSLSQEFQLTICTRYSRSLGFTQTHTDTSNVAISTNANSSLSACV